MIDFRSIWLKAKLPIYMIITAMLFGVIGYKLIFPDQSLSKAFFMTAITLTTVGYGDVLGVESNPIALWFTVILMILGMGIVLYSVSFLTAFIVEGNLGEMFLLKSIRRRVAKMKDHFIICGAGQTGLHVVKEMHETSQSFVVIDSNKENLDLLREEFEGCLVIIGDASSDPVLLEAGVDRAKGLIATLPGDKDNLFITMSARILNPNMAIVSKAVSASIIKKLKNAGATSVVRPNFIGGMRIASEMLRPNVVTFLDRMLRGAEKSIRVEEVIIPKGSKLIGATLDSAKLFEKSGVNVLAYAKDMNGSKYRYNPPLNTQFDEGGVIIFIGDADQHKKLKAAVE